MFSKILTALRHEPALINSVLAILGTVVLVILDVIALNGGEWAVVVAALLGSAGVTRQKVSPVNG